MKSAKISKYIFQNKKIRYKSKPKVTQFPTLLKTKKAFFFSYQESDGRHAMARDYEEYAYLTVVRQPFHASLVRPVVAKENLNVLSIQLDIFLM